MRNSFRPHGNQILEAAAGVLDRERAVRTQHDVELRGPPKFRTCRGTRSITRWSSSGVAFRRRSRASRTLCRYLGTYGTSGPTKFDIVLRADSSLAIKDAGGGFQESVPRAAE